MVIIQSLAAGVKYFKLEEDSGNGFICDPFQLGNFKGTQL